MTANGSIFLANIAGAHAVLRNTIIDVNGIYLIVAEACSGLRYIFPVLSFACGLVSLVDVPRWIKVLIILAAAPVAIVMNAVRVFLIIVIVEARGNADHVEGFAHFLEGWLIFVATIALSFALLWGAIRSSGDKRRLVEVYDFDFAKVRSGFHKLTQIPAMDVTRPVGVTLFLVTCLTVLIAPLTPASNAQIAPPPELLMIGFLYGMSRKSGLKKATDKRRALLAFLSGKPRLRTSNTTA